MTNLKKFLALALSLAMMVTTFTLPAFAAEETTEDTTVEATEAVAETTNAEICSGLKVFRGEGNGLTEEYLASETARWNIALMTLRLRGLEEEAMNYDGEEVFADAEEMTWAAGRPILGYLKAHPELGWLGRGEDNTFDPEGMMNIQEYYKVMLEALGYTQGTDFEWAEVSDMAGKVGIAVAGDTEKLTNSVIADVTVAALEAETKDGEVLIETLIEKGTIDEEAAVDFELVTAVPDAVAVKSAVAFNSKVIEVVLDEAVEETNAAQFVVTDEDDEIFEVESTELAPWDTDNKTVLVYLAEDVKAGDLYTVTSGDDSTHFGGIKVDEDEPKVVTSKSTDYNEIELTFNEAIDLSTLKVEVTKRSKDKKAIEVLDMVYDGSNKVILTTEEQGKGMNDIEVSDAVDYADNEMKDQKVSSVGKEKPDDNIKVVKAYANEYNEVVIQFSQRVGDVDTSMFTLYNRKEKVNNEILDAKVATKDDYFRGEKIDKLSNNAQEFVILTVEEMDKDTYIVEVEDLKSQYDTNIDSKKDSTTFVGIKKPSDAFKLINVKSTSNTEVTLEFENKIDETVGTDISNYEINYRNKSKDALEIKEAKVDGKKVKLTVESMDKGTCTIEVDNDLLDVYGNKLDSSHDKDTFAARDIADKIEKIKSITRDSKNPETKIVVTFDQDLGDNAEDVAFYNINRGIGYPISATTDDSHADQVTLTIPKTVSGKVYELTVNKGMENVDGIVSTDKIEKTFAGKGTSATKASVSWALVSDNQTIKVVFDRSVKDSTIDGVLWNSDDNTIVEGAFTIKDGSTVVDLATGPKSPKTSPYKVHAYQESEEEEILVIRCNNKLFDTTNITNDEDLLLVVNENLVVDDDDKNETEIYSTNDDPQVPELENAFAYSKDVIELVFSEPVNIPNNYTDDNNFGIYSSATKKYSALNNMTKVDDYTYRFKLNKAFDKIEDNMAYVFIKKDFMTDVSGTVKLQDEDKDDILFEIGADYGDLDKIDDIYAEMIDNRTIVVQYNDYMMNENHIKTASNYAVVTSEDDGAELAGVDLQDYTTYKSSENELH